MELIDISVPLRAGMTSWPGSIGLSVTLTQSLAAGDPVNNSRLDCDVHIGTHIDAPRHHLADGAAVDELPLDALVGPAVVAHLPAAAAVTEAELESLRLPPGTERLLLRTRNSERWRSGEAPFTEDYVALAPGAARWVVDHGLVLIGLDYLSIQRFHDGPEVHRVLLGAGVVVVEGVDLTGVEPGSYELICLPLRLAGAEGAPARAVLRRGRP